MFEHRTHPLLPRLAFAFRMIRHGLAAALVVAVSIFIGMAGYHYLEGMSWIDSLLNACMILGGMGPVGELKTVEGKFFASFYALFAGLIFILIAGIIFAPVLHRIMHRFHLDGEEDKV